MKKSKRDHIQAAMAKHSLVFFLMAVLVAFGIWSLPRMNKDEFPQFTIRQGVVVAVYPGATAAEVEQQVTKQLEEFLFSYEEINKENTYSQTEDGIVYIFAELTEQVERKDETWAKIRAGLNLFQKTSLPAGVLQVAVVDDFGNTSSLLLAIESNNHTPRELQDYASQISTALRKVENMGKIKTLGAQQEEIAVTIDFERLSAYGIDRKTLMMALATEGFRSMGGTAGDAAGNATLHVSIPYNTEYEISEQIIFADPLTGQTLRLKDVAAIERRYTEDKRVDYYENGTESSCLIISAEMMPDHNIVEFGQKVDECLAAVSQTLPADIHIHRITDQPRVVDDSVRSFLRDIVISMLVVVLVMLVLFPLKTALVASIGVPVCISITFGLMYIFGVQLHTVTLAALIVVLGMIVDNAVIIVDGYSNMLEQGHSRWYSAAVSTKELFTPTLIATLSIAAMFFPLTRILTGPIGEFVRLFPWTRCFALLACFAFAVWVTPYLATRFIHRQQEGQINWFERMQNRFFSALQRSYERLLTFAFRHGKTTLFFTLVLLLLGGWLFTRLNVQMMPKAERNCFAVEIHLREGSTIRETALVADSLARILEADSLVQSVTAFVGQASPRFHATYAPQMAKPSYAQFIVNTCSQEATVQLLAHYTPLYENAFPNAYIRFKQMDYQAVKNPVEVYVAGDDYAEIAVWSDSLRRFLSQQPEVLWAHTDYDDCTPQMRIDLKQDEATRLGVTQAMLSFYLNSYFSGEPLTSIWEGDYNIPVTLYSSDADSIDFDGVKDLLVPTSFPGVWVPLHQVATLTPVWEHATMGHRNGVRTVTVACDLKGSSPQPETQKKVVEWVKENMPTGNGITVTYGGLTAVNDKLIPEIILSVAAALLVMFLVLLYHFGAIGISLLTLSTSVLCLFGAMLGLYIFRLDFSITAVLGIVSLIGIIVRNAIMMYEYADQLRTEQHLSVRDAAYEAGLRRMRPIFLTSATTALGVIPMIIAHTALWMPMGVVICFGTIFTLPLVVTVLPVAYWKVYDRSDKQKNASVPAKTLAVALLAGGLFIPSAMQAQTLSLDSCLTLARQNNHALRQQQYAVEQAQEVKMQALTKYFPQVQGTAMGFASLDPYISIGTDNIDNAAVRDVLNLLYSQYGHALGLKNPYTFIQNGYSAGVIAVQPVYMGGKIVAGNRLAQVGVEAAQLQQQVAERDKLLEVEQSYWLCVGLEQKQQTVEVLSALLDTLHNVVAAANETGLAMPADMLKVELKQRELEATTLQLTNGIRLARRALCQAVGIECSDSIRLVNDTTDVPLIEEQTENGARPETQLLALQVRAAQLEKRMTVADALPHVLVGGGYAYSKIFNNPKPNGTAFVSVTVPLTAWWETGHKIKQHNLKIKAAQEQQADMNEMMQLQTLQAYDRMNEAYALALQQEQSVRTAEENYRLTLLGYEAGTVTVSELLESHAMLMQASNAYTDALLSARIAQRTYMALTINVTN